MTPEAQARAEIDRLLQAAGWHVCDYKSADIRAARGVAIREFELSEGHGTADYLLYIDGKAAGVIEAKKQGATLTGVEHRSERYARGLPTMLPVGRAAVVQRCSPTSCRCMAYSRSLLPNCFGGQPA